MVRSGLSGPVANMVRQRTNRCRGGSFSLVVFIKGDVAAEQVSGDEHKAGIDSRDGSALR